MQWQMKREENIVKNFFLRRKKRREKQILSVEKGCDFIKWTMSKHAVWYHFAIECLKIHDAFIITEGEKKNV